MLARDWFKPEMPMRELLLGLYEWICDENSTQEMGARVEVLQGEASKEFVRAMVFALMEHKHCVGIRLQDEGGPTLKQLRAWSKEVTDDYFAREITND